MLGPAGPAAVRTEALIRHDALGPLAVPVDQIDLARTSTHNHRQKARRTNRASSNNSDFHARPPPSFLKQ